MSNGINGYGLTIYNDGTQDVCGLLDGSPVLRPTRIERTATGRRFRFVEGSRELRTLGDVFCANMDTAGFVREAINDKLERDRDVMNAFRITSTRISQRRRYRFLRVSVAMIQTCAEEAFDFTLEAPSYEVQQDGQREFAEFLSALSLRAIDDSDELIGLTATSETVAGERRFKKWAQ